MGTSVWVAYFFVEARQFLCSEVFRTTDPDTGKLLAIKRIKMKDESDGVCPAICLFDSDSRLDKLAVTVSNFCDTRNQGP